MSEHNTKIDILFNIHLITQLKHTYLNACDQKDSETMKSVFSNPCSIDYGKIGTFTNPDDLAKIFQDIGCHEYMKETHHAHNPIITILNQSLATGTWSLTYTLINTKDKTHTILQGTYEDEYQKQDDHWKITQSIFKPSSQLQFDISKDILKILLVG